jgi:hypothetical protein
VCGTTTDKIFSVGPYALPGDNDTPYMTLMLPRKLYEAEVCLRSKAVIVCCG